MPKRIPGAYSILIFSSSSLVPDSLQREVGGISVVGLFLIKKVALSSAKFKVDRKVAAAGIFTFQLFHRERRLYSHIPSQAAQQRSRWRRRRRPRRLTWSFFFLPFHPLTFARFYDRPTLSRFAFPALLRNLKVTA